MVICHEVKALNVLRSMAIDCKILKRDPVTAWVTSWLGRCSWILQVSNKPCSHCLGKLLAGRMFVGFAGFLHAVQSLPG